MSDAGPPHLLTSETDFPCKHRSRRVASGEQTRATSGRPNWLVAQISCFSSQLSALFADLVRSAAHWCIDPRLLAGACPVTTEVSLCPVYEL